MAYDLIPNNKKAGELRIGTFMWPVILNITGACYILRYGDNTARIGFYVYDGKWGPGSPVTNDGYRVSNEESKAMAKVFKGYAFVKKAILEDLENLTESEKVALQAFNKNNQPPSKEVLDRIEDLAAFCEKAEGFRIK